VEVQSSKQRVTVLYPAEPPGKKNLAPPLRLAGLAGFGGLLLGVFGVAWREARARRIRGKEEVAGELGVRGVGELPWLAGAPEHAGESVDCLRAQLLCDAEDRPRGRVLMVTSAVPQEGKTTLASHLAVSVARAGKRTLLLDCDFRRPALHQVFDLPRG